MTKAAKDLLAATLVVLPLSFCLDAQAEEVALSRNI